jgi:hypothetical protein
VPNKIIQPDATSLLGYCIDFTITVSFFDSRNIFDIQSFISDCTVMLDTGTVPLVTTDRCCRRLVITENHGLTNTANSLV